MAGCSGGLALEGAMTLSLEERGGSGNGRRRVSEEWRPEALGSLGWERWGAFFHQKRD